MTEDPTGDQLPEVRDKYPDRFSAAAEPAEHLLQLPEHHDAAVRQASRRARRSTTRSDSRALIRVFSGRLQPGCNFLPPGVTGYEEADCAYGDPNGEPDIEKAKELVKQSGYEGEHVTYWTNNKDPRPAIADYFVDVLNEIGFDADVKTLDQQVYFSKIGDEATRTRRPGSRTGSRTSRTRATSSRTCSRARGRSTREVTFNQGFVSDPVIDKKLDELRGEDPEDVADEWAALDDYVVNEKAYVERLRQRGVDLVLLGADGRRELQRRCIRSTRTTGSCSA